MDRTDLVVAGGGRPGLRPPIDKACGEGLMPDGVELLVELGVDLAAAALRGD